MTQPLFTASQIAAQAGVSSKTIHRRAVAEHWQRRPQGTRIGYVAPRGLGAKCEALSGPRYNPARLLRELHRAAAVLGFLRILDKMPYIGREAALEMTQREFVVIHKFSTVQLRRWVKLSTQSGLAGLSDRRPGRSGRKAMNRPHAYRITRAKEVAAHLQSGKSPAQIARLLCCDQQTVKRDMRLLRLLGYSLSYDTTTRQWECLAPGRAKP